MTLGNSEGERRCDARCYNAKSAKCTCICGGMNHGKGESVAAALTEDHALTLLERWRDAGVTLAPELLKALEEKRPCRASFTTEV